MLTRRSFLTLCAFAAAAPLPFVSAWAAALPPITVHKDPNCGCCGAWVDHLRKAGFQVSVKEEPGMNRIKARLGVRPELASCHTAEIAGYVVEGHVPASAIERLLKERPKATGLAVPGMPIGSPGMEVEGQAPETYEVLLFDAAGSQVFARYKGDGAV
jgi:hypothetical protein